MKSSTKKALLAIGGITAGVLAASIGGGFIGMAITGIFLRTGVTKLSPQVMMDPLVKQGVAILSSTKDIARNVVAGSACAVAGIAQAVSSGAKLADATREEIQITTKKDPASPDFNTLEAS